MIIFLHNWGDLADTTVLFSMYYYSLSYFVQKCLTGYRFDSNTAVKKPFISREIQDLFVNSLVIWSVIKPQSLPFAYPLIHPLQPGKWIVYDLQLECILCHNSNTKGLAHSTCHILKDTSPTRISSQELLQDIISYVNNQ